MILRNQLILHFKRDHPSEHPLSIASLSYTENWGFSTAEDEAMKALTQQEEKHGMTEKKNASVEIFLWHQTRHEVYGIYVKIKQNQLPRACVIQLLPFLVAFVLAKRKPWLKTLGHKFIRFWFTVSTYSSYSIWKLKSFLRLVIRYIIDI